MRNQMTDRPRVLLLAGYFDWFSGYQEIALARWFPRHATTEVIAGDRVSRIFSDDHLAQLGVPRRYEPGTRHENGVKVTRFSTSEMRSMVWSAQTRRYIESQQYDLIVQLMPGTVMPFGGTLARNDTVRAALYVDNSAMWSHLSTTHRILKGAAFAVSKGVLYTLINRRADLVYAFTPNTVSRLRLFAGGKKMSLRPLTFDPKTFYFDEGIRDAHRRRLGYATSDTVLVAAGKFQRQKRFDLLLEVFSSLASRHAGLKLLLVGADDGACSRELRAQIDADPALSKSVTLSGFVDTAELNAVFNAADIGVWPAMPAITIQQAMGTGLTVVLPQNNWVGHLIRDGSGCYFDGSDERASTHLHEALEGQLPVDSGTSARKKRAAVNSWLGADELVKSLLRDAGLDQWRNGGGSDCESS